MKKRKRNLKGTVLFTTVSVMALLILFLLGTLTLASASNNRAHKTYSSSQANYTARAAIDGFIEAMVRDEKVEAAVIEVGKDAGPTVINPKVSVSDSSLGRIGYIDNSGVWHEGQIVVEKVADKAYEYIDKDNKAADDKSTDAKWVEVDRVKITATAKVGKEYETVVAYLNKKQGTIKKENPSGTPQVKGLQMLGGANFPAGRRITGGLGVSLESTADPETLVNALRNTADIETTLTFINSSFIWKTNDSHLNIFAPKPEASDTPYSQTVVTGNMYVDNRNILVNVDYEIPGTGDNKGPKVKDIKDWTLKDIPYLYIDKCLYLKDGTYIENTNNSPFNLICGTLYTGNPSYFKGTNIYMMDAPSTEEYTINSDGGTIKRKKGDNYLYFDGTNLEKWASSIAAGTEVPAEAVGGSVFCNGNLTIYGKNSTIKGDLIVDGNLTMATESDGKITVEGKVVVGGTISNAGQITCSNIQQNVKSGGGGTPSPSYAVNKTVTNQPAPGGITEADFSLIDVGTTEPIGYISWTPMDHSNKDIFGLDADNPSVTRYYRYNDDAVFWRNFDPNDSNSIVNTKAYDELEADPAFIALRDSIDRTVVYTEMERPVNEYDLSNDHYFGVPVLYTNDDGSTSIERSCKPADHNVKYYRYEAERKVVTEEEKNQIIADSSSSGSAYYRVDFDDNVTADITTSDTTYYVDATTWGYTEAEAIAAAETKYGAGGGTSGSVYPKDMLRSAIYMKEDGSTADDATKIITNITEARQALGLQTDGLVSAKVYKHIYSSTETNTSSPIYAGNYTSVDAGEKIDISSYMATRYTSIDDLKNATSGVEIKGSGTNRYFSITSDCTLSGLYDKYKVSDSDSEVQEIHIDPKGGELNIVFNDFATQNGVKVIVEAGGHVNFYVVGYYKNNGQQEGVFSSELLSGSCNFDYTKDWGMVWYGAKDSSITLVNDDTLMGSFKMPYTTFDSSVRGAKATYTYTDEYGKKFIPGSDDGNPYAVIIGNALFKSVSGTNAISNYYTATGADSSGADTTKPVETSTGNFWDVKYMLAS